MYPILGVYDGHDAGAALIHDGEIYAVNEERLSREKYHRGFPELSIKEVIRQSELEPDDIKKVAVAGVYRRKKRLLNMKRSLQKLVGDVDILTVHHHEAHAAGSYFTSGFDEGIVLTIDAAGDGLSSTIYLSNDGELKKIAESSYLDSIGDFYASITKMLGFTPMRHEGKIMALGSYYQGEDHFDFSDCIEVDGLGFNNHLEVTGSESVRKLSNKVDFPLNRSEECADVLRSKKRKHELWKKAVRTAASAQKHLEKLLQKICINIKEDSMIDQAFKENICYSGGVAQNVKSNRVVSNHFKNSFVFPHMGDGGLALGAALYVNQKLNDEKTSWDWKSNTDNVYLGPSFKGKRIKKALDNEEKIELTSLEEKEEVVSSLLAEGKIIGLFQGKMEYGPRSLGNRSIIADPSNADIKERLNSMLGRESFQPFSPTILKEYQTEYLRSDDTNRFMTISFDITERAKEDLTAAVHVDNTCRPQILERDDNPVYYDIIKKFEEKTGIGGVLNTSFNLHGEPIVCRPKEAVESFKKIGLDALLCEEYLVG